MNYKLTVHSDTNIPHGKKNVRNTFTDSYSTEDVETIKELVSDYTDCPEYEMTDENIRKNFGCDDIRQENLDQIRTYYNFRKLIYGDLLKHIEDGLTGTFKYEIPEEVNSYVVREIPEDEETRQKEKQFAYYIELSIEK